MTTRTSRSSSLAVMVEVGGRDDEEGEGVDVRSCTQVRLRTLGGLGTCTRNMRGGLRA